MANKLTFKRGSRSTGLSSVADPWPHTEIKLNRRRVGTIAPPSHSSLRPEPNWRVWTFRIDPTAGGGFRNVCFAAKFDTEQSARDWVTHNEEAIIAKGLYQMED